MNLNHPVSVSYYYMTDDCIFYTAGGSSSFGTCYEGHAIVKERFESVWKDLPDVAFVSKGHFLSGEKGCSEWTLKATRPGGSKMEVDGCDLFTFENNKIKVKNTYLKNRS